MTTIISTLDPRFRGVVPWLREILSRCDQIPPTVISALPYPVERGAIAPGRSLELSLSTHRVRVRPGSTHEHIVVIPEHEEVNDLLVRLEHRGGLAGILADAPGDIILYPFTTSRLAIGDQRVKVAGPPASLARQLDDKVEQRRLFDRFEVPTPPWRECPSLASAVDLLSQLPENDYVVTPRYGSGGVGITRIRTERDVARWLKSLPQSYSTQEFIVSDFVPHVLSPNTTGFVSRGREVIVFPPTDQILQGQHYLGNVYPSRSSKSATEAMLTITRSIGERLALIGYRGFFGLDFVLDRHSKPLAVDLNPRRQGGFFTNLAAGRRISAAVVDWILADELGRTMDRPGVRDIARVQSGESGFSWAQVKLRPPTLPFKIARAVACGSEEACFSGPPATLVRSFFPVGTTVAWGSFLGHAIATAQGRHACVSYLAQAVKGAKASLRSRNFDVPAKD